MRNTLIRYVYAGRPPRPARKRGPAYIQLRYMRPRPPFVRLYAMMFVEWEMRAWGLCDVVIRRRPEPRP